MSDPVFTPAKVAPPAFAGVGSAEWAPQVAPIIVPDPPSERRIMLDRMGELQARRDSLTEDELVELRRLGRLL